RAGARGRGSGTFPLRLPRRSHVSPEHVPAPAKIRETPASGGRFPGGEDLRRLQGDLPRERPRLLRSRRGQVLSGGRHVSATAVDITEAYYDSDEADRFYFHIWGGEDIHVGIYEPGDTIREASKRTVARMIEQVGEITKDMRVLDLGAGYGGSARSEEH